LLELSLSPGPSYCPATCEEPIVQRLRLPVMPAAFSTPVWTLVSFALVGL
jgi:hypothetical protein